MKAYWGSGGIAARILDLGTRWRWVVSFTPRPLYPQRKNPSTHWIGGWEGPRGGLDAVVKRKIPGPYRDSKPNHPVRSSASYNWAIPAPPDFELNLFICKTPVFVTQVILRWPLQVHVLLNHWYKVSAETSHVLSQPLLIFGRQTPHVFCSAD
jgi:hypothetical protein